MWNIVRTSATVILGEIMIPATLLPPAFPRKKNRKFKKKLSKTTYEVDKCCRIIKWRILTQTKFEVLQLQEATLLIYEWMKLYFAILSNNRASNRHRLTHTLSFCVPLLNSASLGHHQKWENVTPSIHPDGRPHHRRTKLKSPILSG